MKTNKNNIKILKIGLLFLGIALIFSFGITASVAANATNLTNSSQFYTGQSQYQGPQTNNTKWKYNGNICGDPVIGSNGTVYVASYTNDYVNYSLNAMNPNGTLKWKYSPGVADLTLTDPTIGNDGTIYVAGQYSSSDFSKQSSILYALNTNGTLKWKYNLGNITAEYLGYGNGTIYVESLNMTSEGTEAYPDDGYFYAITSTGTLKWKKNIMTNFFVIGSDGTIYYGADDLYALNLNGTQKWKYSPSTNLMPTSLAIGNNGTIYAGFSSLDYSTNGLYAINPNGTLKWKYSSGSNMLLSLSVSSNGTIYTQFSAPDGMTNGLYAINPNGTTKWNYSTGTSTMYMDSIIGADGIIYAGFINYDGNNNGLYAINSNGTLKWKYLVGDYVISSPAISSDKTLYFEISDGLNGILCAMADITAFTNLKGGYYNTSKTIALTTNTPGTIYYTINSTAPTTTSTKYTGPITITATTTLEFIAVDKSGHKSPVYTQIYTIDKTAPIVNSTNPVNNSTNIPVNQTIKVTFSEQVKSGSAYSSITLKTSGGTVIPITTSISGNVLTITHSTLLAKGTKYILTIPVNSVTDLAGNPLALWSSNFTTSKT